MFKLRNRYMEAEPAAEAPGEGAEALADALVPSKEPAPPQVIENWKDSLGPDLRDNPSLKDVPDVATLAKQYLDTKAMVGQSIRVPTDEAGEDAVREFAEKLLAREHLPLMRKPDPESPESLEAVYKALGRPEDASGYTPPEGADAEVFGALAPKALELGLSNAQFQKLAQAQLELTNTQIEAMTQEREASVAQVKGEWGPAFDQKVNRAMQVAEALKAPPELVEALAQGQVNGPTLRFMDTIATQLGAEGTPLAEQLGQVTAETIAELEQKISERTKRILNESMSQKEKEGLIEKNVADRQRIIDSRK